MADEIPPRSLVTGAAYDVVALTASAGGFGALSAVLGSLEAISRRRSWSSSTSTPRHRSLMARRRAGDP